MGIVGVRRALRDDHDRRRASGGWRLSGCSEPRRRGPHRADAPRPPRTRWSTSTSRPPAPTGPRRSPSRTTATSTSRPVLAGLVADVVEVADDLDYPAYPLTLVPAIQPDVDADRRRRLPRARRRGRGPRPRGSRSPTRCSARSRTSRSRDGETITVDSDGGAAHDVAEVQRIGHGDRPTPPGCSGRARRPSRSTAGCDRPTWRSSRPCSATPASEGQPVWARAWQLDRRADPRAARPRRRARRPPTSAPRRLTVARYGRTLAPAGAQRR